MSGTWIEVCRAEEIDEKDVFGFEYRGEKYGVYHTPSGFYATDGVCTHEAADLAMGLVIDDIIECPKHQGRFHIPTGKAKGAPACVDLKTYPVKVADGMVFIDLPGCALATRYSVFPGSGRKIGKLGFGAMGFAGWFGAQAETEHIRALHRALDLGVNFVDTAAAYGESERIVGTALRQWTGEAPFLATKIECLGPNRRWSTPTPVETTFPKGHVRASCERSLAALGVDQLDLIQLHVYWPVWGLDGYWMEELQALKSDGKARFVGVSMPDHRSDLALPLVTSGLIDAVQTIINIFDPLALENLVPTAQAHDVAVIGRCILDEGGLTGFLTEDVAFPEGDYRNGYFDKTIPRAVYMAKVAALERFVPRHAGSLAALAIKFAVHHAGVTTALSSMHVREHAEANVAALDEPPLADEVFDELMTRYRFIKNLNHPFDEWD